MKNRRFLFTLITSGFILLIIIVTKIFSLSENATTKSDLPTDNPSPIVLSRSVCHAIHVNVSDPQAFLPDPTCTPGSIDPFVTQDNIGSTICRSGYTKTKRPSTYYTNRIKKEQIRQYGYIDMNIRNYEEDHFIPLELGGSPDDPKNLWPEPHPSFNEKDKVENFLHKKVCKQEMSLYEAQHAIQTNWYDVFIQNHL